MNDESDSRGLRTIFDLPAYFRFPEQAQKWLDATPFPRNRPLHLPDHEDVERVKHRLRALFQSGEVYGVDILEAYQELTRSAQTSDIICGKRDRSTQSRCGGIMDIQVSAFGLFYLCRANPKHKYPK